MPLSPLLLSLTFLAVAEVDVGEQLPAAEAPSLPEANARILPTASIVAARVWEGPLYGSIHAGVAAHWVRAEETLGRTGYFAAVALELDFRHVQLLTRRESVLTWTPTVRGGFSMFDLDGFPFPAVMLYAIAGVQLGSAAQPTSLRVGLGLSSPLLTVASLSAEAFLPSLAELVLDQELVSGRLAPTFRFGWCI